MHARRPVPDALLTLAHLQASVVTTEQAIGHGLSEAVLVRLARDGGWTRLTRGVYLVTEQPPDWLALAWAGVLLGGDHARLGPLSSAHLWKLGSAPDPVDVLVPTGSARKVRGHWVFARERPRARSARTVGDPPRLTAVDVVLDLSNERDEAAVVDLVLQATGRRLVTPARLAEALAQRRLHGRRGLLTELVSDAGEGAESSLERRYLRDVERAHDLPGGHRQRHRGGLSYRTDVGYDAYAVLVELDGRLGHEGAGRFRDYRRDNAFALRAFVTLRYGWWDVVDRPCQVAVQVAAVLQSRGWDGLLGRCAQCQQAADADLC